MTNKANKKTLIFISAVIIMSILVSIIACIFLYKSLIAREFNKNGLISLDDAMISCGYTKSALTNESHKISYSKIDTGTPIDITFDTDSNLVYKNSYSFIVSQYYKLNNEIYIAASELSLITNYSYQREKAKIVSEPIDYGRDALLQNFNPLIAHAGGSVRGYASDGLYTNSFEALSQNYTIGHRLFEFDFSLTSDYQLAAVHDWSLFGNKDGTAMSLSEWHNSLIDNKFTTLSFDKILNEMVVNKDMYIVTDTKSFDISEEEMRTQLNLIYNKALNKDEELLSRIIIQIYDKEMYDELVKIYSPETVIFTLYATKMSKPEILQFLSDTPCVFAVTMPSWFGYIEDPEFLSNIKALNKKIYAHTLNNYSDFAMFLGGYGIDGLYTDYLTPNDLDNYLQNSRN